MTERWLGLSDAAAVLHESVACVEHKILHRELPARQTNDGWQVLVERDNLDMEQPDSAFLSAMDQMTHDQKSAANETGALGMISHDMRDMRDMHDMQDAQGTPRPSASGDTASNAAASRQAASTETPKPSNAHSAMASNTSRDYVASTSGGPPLKPPPPPRISDIPRPWMGLVAIFLLVLIAWLWITVGSASITGRDGRDGRNGRNGRDGNEGGALALTAKTETAAPSPDWIIEYDAPSRAQQAIVDQSADPSELSESSETASAPQDSQALALDILAAPQTPLRESTLKQPALRILAKLELPDASKQIIRPKPTPPRHGDWRDVDLALGGTPQIKTYTSDEIFKPDDPAGIEPFDATPTVQQTLAVAPTVKADRPKVLPTENESETNPAEPGSETTSSSTRDDSQVASREPIAPTAPHWPSSGTMPAISPPTRAADTQWTEHLGRPVQFVLMMSPIPNEVMANENPSPPQSTTESATQPEKVATQATQRDVAAAPPEQAHLVSAVTSPTLEQPQPQPSSKPQRKTAQPPVTHRAQTSAMHKPYYCPDCFN